MVWVESWNYIPICVVFNLSLNDVLIEALPFLSLSLALGSTEKEKQEGSTCFRGMYVCCWLSWHFLLKNEQSFFLLRKRASVRETIPLEFFATHLKLTCFEIANIIQRLIIPEWGCFVCESYHSILDWLI